MYRKRSDPWVDQKERSRRKRWRKRRHCPTAAQLSTRPNKQSLSPLWSSLSPAADSSLQLSRSRFCLFLALRTWTDPLCSTPYTFLPCFVRGERTKKKRNGKIKKRGERKRRLKKQETLGSNEWNKREERRKSTSERNGSCNVTCSHENLNKSLLPSSSQFWISFRRFSTNYIRPDLPSGWA